MQVRPWLLWLSPAEDHEVDRVATAFRCFFSVLASYYLVLPVRDAAAVSLGTAALPKLFAISLGVTLVTAPAASTFLGQTGHSRSKRVHRLFSFMALCLVGFAAAHWVSSSASLPAAATISTAQTVMNASLYLWLSAANLVAVSVMWASAADAFDAAAAARLFGFLAAGATSGQLAGSAVAGVAAAVASRSPALERLLPIVLLLGSAAMVETAGRCAAALSNVARHTSSKDSNSKVARDTGLAAFIAGFKLIISKPYLRTIAAFLAMNYSVSSAFYFVRQLVAATGVSSSSGRTAFFAAINGVSAALVLMVQVFLTGRLLQKMPPGLALAILPLTAATLLAVLAVQPTPVMVAAAEVLRKLIAYGVARPAREILFTVVSSEDKYRAKVVLDTVVQRLGDAAAAAAFSWVTNHALLGPSTFPVIVVPLCLTWAGLAVMLGSQQRTLQRSSSSHDARFLSLGA